MHVSAKALFISTFSDGGYTLHWRDGIPYQPAPKRGLEDRARVMNEGHRRESVADKKNIDKKNNDHEGCVTTHNL